jgi:hypothetical protein
MFLFVPRSLACFEMGPLRREEGSDYYCPLPPQFDESVFVFVQQTQGEGVGPGPCSGRIGESRP